MPTANIVGAEPQWWQCGYYCASCAICALFTGLVGVTGLIGVAAAAH